LLFLLRSFITAASRRSASFDFNWLYDTTTAEDLPHFSNLKKRPPGCGPKKAIAGALKGAFRTKKDPPIGRS
jgi:hypothetical protein